MTSEKYSATEAYEEVRNPNSIGELLSVGHDLPVEDGYVYRSLGGAHAEDAIRDLYSAQNKEHVVRNAFSAGIKQTSRWGDRVFWSAGKQGQFHPVQEGGYVLVVTREAALRGPVTMDDIKYVYTKEDGVVKEVRDDLYKKYMAQQSEEYQVPPPHAEE